MSTWTSDVQNVQNYYLVSIQEGNFLFTSTTAVEVQVYKSESVTAT